MEPAGDAALPDIPFDIELLDIESFDMPPFIESFDMDDDLCDELLGVMLFFIPDDDDDDPEDIEPLPVVPPLLEAPPPMPLLSAPPPPPPPPPCANTAVEPTATQVTKTNFENNDIFDPVNKLKFTIGSRSFAPLYEAIGSSCRQDASRFAGFAEGL